MTTRIGELSVTAYAGAVSVGIMDDNTGAMIACASTMSIPQARMALQKFQRAIHQAEQLEHA